MVAHHDALRSRFLADGGGVRWLIDGPAARCRLTRHTGPDTDAPHLGPYDLDHGPLLRAVLHDRGDGWPPVLHLSVHHLVVDGVSWRLLVEDLEHAYHARRDGRDGAAALPRKSSPLRQWAERLAAHTRRRRLRRGEGLLDPGDRGRPGGPARGPGGHQHLRLPALGDGADQPRGHRPAAADPPGDVPHPGQRRPARRARPGAVRLERARAGPGRRRRARPRGPVRRRRHQPHRRLVHHPPPRGPGRPARGRLGRRAQAGQGTPARRAPARHRPRRPDPAGPRRRTASGDQRADQLQLPRPVRPVRDLAGRPVPRAGPPAGTGRRPRLDAPAPPGGGGAARRRQPGVHLVPLRPAAPAGDRRGPRGTLRRRAGRPRPARGPSRRRRTHPLGLPAGPARPDPGRPDRGGRTRRAWRTSTRSRPPRPACSSTGFPRPTAACTSSS